MPLFLCAECVKKHIPSESDAYVNLYCYHTYLLLKTKLIKKVIDKKKSL